MKHFILFSILTLSLQASAQLQLFDLSNATVLGPGCLAGESVIDAQNNEILLSNMVADSERAGGALVRKSCNIAIPMNLPKYQVAIFSEIQGFKQLDSGSSAQVTAENFFAGDDGHVLKENFSGPVTDDYWMSTQISWSNLKWSTCGSSIARLNISVLANKNALVTVDKIKFRLIWKRCK